MCHVHSTLPGSSERRNPNKKHTTPSGVITISFLKDDDDDDDDDDKDDDEVDVRCNLDVL